MSSQNIRSFQKSEGRVFMWGRTWIFFVINRWITPWLPLVLMQGRQFDFVNLTWYALHQWNVWKGKLWRLVYNNKDYYVFKFYSCSWLVKPQRIIHRISKMTRYFSCWRDQRAIIPSFGPNFGPKQSIMARCRTQAPSTVGSLVKFPPKLNIVWE